MNAPGSTNCRGYDSANTLYDHLCTLLRWIRVQVGTGIEKIRGPSMTTIYRGRQRFAVERLYPSIDDPEIDLTLEARETIYVTRYQRSWVPERKRSIYEVQGSVSDEYRHLFDARLFDTVTYPMLCSRRLRGTRYPHYIAMLAFLNRVYPVEHPFRHAFKRGTSRLNT